MYTRLIIEMRKRGISQIDIAEKIGRRKESVGLKIRGKSEFTSSEMYAICEMIPDVPMQDLFIREA